jgi:hypothetical protein
MEGTRMSERLHIDIDDESFRRLTALAVQERRPIGWQAEVLLIQAIAEQCAPALKGDPQEEPCHSP